MSLFNRKKTDRTQYQDTRPADGYIPTTLPPHVSAMGYQIANLQGVGAREYQEDSFALSNAFDEQKIRDKGLLFVVCDGMGGMEGGKEASEIAVAAIRQVFQRMEPAGDIVAQLREGVYAASDRIEELLEGRGGTTAVVGIIYREKLYYISVGDSFIFLKRGQNLYRLNRDHNLCNHIYLSCIRDGNMNPEEARNHIESAALTQFLGMRGLDETDELIRPLPLKDGDVLMACSDGVGGVLTSDEIIRALEAEQPQDMCMQVEEAIVAHNRMNQDNYTAIIIKCVK